MIVPGRLLCVFRRIFSLVVLEKHLPEVFHSSHPCWRLNMQSDVWIVRLNKKLPDYRV